MSQLLPGYPTTTEALRETGAEALGRCWRCNNYDDLTVMLRVIGDIEIHPKCLTSMSAPELFDLMGDGEVCMDESKVSAVEICASL